MFEWRLLMSPPLDGPTNMALDHALAQLAGAGQAPPTVRFYTWDPHCVSLGYFQPYSDLNEAAWRATGYGIVRRPTGGRAIVHQDELTYAITAAATTPGFGGAILASYSYISGGLHSGLRQLGAPIDPARPATNQKTTSSAACFDTPADYEITVGGRKLVGSAQTRTRGGVLQHGSVLLQADPLALEKVLNLPEGLDAGALGQKLIALDEALGRPVSVEETAAALVCGFETSWGVRLVPGALSPTEEALAKRLRAERYAHDGWTRRR